MTNLRLNYWEQHDGRSVYAIGVADGTLGRLDLKTLRSDIEDARVANDVATRFSAWAAANPQES